MSDLFEILTSNGPKPFLNINCNSLNSTTSVDAASVDIGSGPASVGLINFENLPFAPSPLLGHTIMVCDSTDSGRPTINNGTLVHKLAYVDELPPSSQLSSSIIFKQGAVSSGDTYGTWLEVANIITAKDGLVDIYVDDSIVSPCVVSSNVDCKNRTQFFGSSNAASLNKLEISGGFALSNPKSFNTLEVRLVSPALPNILLVNGSIMSLVNGAQFTSVDSTVPNISFPDGASIVLSTGIGGNINNSGNIIIRLGIGSSMIVAVLENAGNLMLNNFVDSVDASSSLILGYDSTFDLANFNNPGFLGTLITQNVSVASSVKYNDSTSPSYGSTNVQGVLDKIKSVLTFGPSFLISALPVNAPSVAVNTLTPNAKLHTVGSLGSAFAMDDGSQASGYVLKCIGVTGQCTWVDVNSLILYYGSLYYEDAVGASTSFPFGVMSNKYLINPGSASGPGFGFSVPVNGRLEYIGLPTREFAFTITISYANDAGLFQQQIYFWPSMNGTPIVGSSTTQTTSLVTTDFVTTTMSFLVSLATNDYIELYASNESDTTGIKVHSLQIVCS